MQNDGLHGLSAAHPPLETTMPIDIVRREY
jgi:hypothetical protein